MVYTRLRPAAHRPDGHEVHDSPGVSLRCVRVGRLLATFSLHPACAGYSPGYIPGYPPVQEH